MPLVDRLLAEAQKLATGHSSSPCQQQQQHYPYDQGPPPPPPQQWSGYGYGYSQGGSASPQPPPYGYGHPHPQYAQQQYGFHAPPAARAPAALLFKEGGGKRTWSLVSAETRQAAYTVEYSSSMSTHDSLKITRGGGGGGSGEPVGSATFHSFTTSKVDMELVLAGAAGGGRREVRWRKEFDSVAGQGRLAWKAEGGDLVLYGGGGGGGGKHHHHHHQQPLATFYLDKGPRTAKHQSGRFEFHHAQQPLGQHQVDEIVVSGVTELERRRVEAQTAKGVSGGGEGAGEAVAALVG